MKALPIIKTAGASLLLTVLLSSGAVPAQAALDCTWPVQANGIGATCDRPQINITQADPATVGTPVLISGSGFKPGEPVSIVDRDGSNDMSTLADADGTFLINWAVPDFALGLAPMLSAIGSVSQYETEAFQVRQDAAVISDAGNGVLQGWYPGEELLITVNGQPHSSQYASAEGTSDTFMNIKSQAGARIEVRGKQSGGFFGRTALGTIGGNVRPVRPAPVEVPVEVIEVPVEPVIEMPAEPAPEVSEVVEPPVESAPVVNVPAPTRPQPQAAVTTNQAAGASLALLGGTSAAFFASVLGLRRLRTKNNSQ